jgi:hypothetical protein
VSVLKPDFSLVISKIEDIMQGKGVAIDGVVAMIDEAIQDEFSEIVEKLDEIRDRVKNAVGNYDKKERYEELNDITDELNSWMK